MKQKHLRFFSCIQNVVYKIRTVLVIPSSGHLNLNFYSQVAKSGFMYVCLMYDVCMYLCMYVSVHVHARILVCIYSYID